MSIAERDLAVGVRCPHNPHAPDHVVDTCRRYTAEIQLLVAELAIHFPVAIDRIAELVGDCVLAGIVVDTGAGALADIEYQQVPEWGEPLTGLELRHGFVGECVLSIAAGWKEQR
jgi:hypothetical protein